jgi:hypothetical protein
MTGYICRKNWEGGNYAAREATVGKYTLAEAKAKCIELAPSGVVSFCFCGRNSMPLIDEKLDCYFTYADKNNVLNKNEKWQTYYVCSATPPWRTPAATQTVGQVAPETGADEEYPTSPDVGDYVGYKVDAWSPSAQAWCRGTVIKQGFNMTVRYTHPDGAPFEKYVGLDSDELRGWPWAYPFEKN